MKRFIADTNIISESSPGRVSNQDVLAWIDKQSSNLFLSVATITEVRAGIEKLRREGATAKAKRLEQWFETVNHIYLERILAFDMPIAGIAGVMFDRSRGLGQAPGFADIIIAATAQYHGMAVLTRNVKHFVPLGVKVIDPFSALP